MSNPRVSVIIPTCGRPEKLHRALQSVDNQSYDNIEIIVIETPVDGQVVGGAKIQDAVTYPVQYEQTDRDIGAAGARNLGIETASGEYIAFLDDDDEWLDKKTQMQVDQLQASDSETRASIVGNKKINASGDKINEYRPPEPTDPVQFQLCWNIGTFSMLMIESDGLTKIGPLDTSFDRREDQDFLLRIVNAFNLGVIQQPLVRKHSGDYDQLGEKYEAIVKANARFQEKHQSLIREKGMKTEVQTAFEFTTGRTALTNGMYPAARRHFFNAIRQKPLDMGHILHFIIALGGRPAYTIAQQIQEYF